MFNKNINFSIESAKKTTIYNLLFLTELYSSKNDNKQPSEMRIQHHSSYFTVITVFLGLGIILKTGLKYWLTDKFLQICFYLQTVLWK